MSILPLGIHHVTAIASDPQANVDFYLEVLGLRLAKRTVNFDSPDIYHLYYGDEAGSPGSILTFFPWPGARPGRRGAGQASTTSFSVPEPSLGWWEERLRRLGVHVGEPGTRLEEDVLSFSDPDGLGLELVASPAADDRPPWEGGPVPVEYAIRGLAGVTLSEAGAARTAGLLTGTLGFRPVAEEGDRFRFDVGDGGPGTTVDVLDTPDAERGSVAAGSVHHVAWRAPDAPTQLGWRDEIVATGLDVTPVLDRQYFRSIYSAGRVASSSRSPPTRRASPSTKTPLTWAKSCVCPPWLEPSREKLESVLPPLTFPPPGQHFF